MPDGLQIGKSNENTSVFIDFQRIPGWPGGVAGILITWSKEGKTSVAGGAAGILITWSKEGKTSVAGGRRLVTYNIAN